MIEIETRSGTYAAQKSGAFRSAAATFCCSTPTLKAMLLKIASLRHDCTEATCAFAFARSCSSAWVDCAP